MIAKSITVLLKVPEILVFLGYFVYMYCTNYSKSGMIGIIGKDWGFLRKNNLLYPHTYLGSLDPTLF